MLVSREEESEREKRGRSLASRRNENVHAEALPEMGRRALRDGAKGMCGMERGSVAEDGENTGCLCPQPVVSGSNQPALAILMCRRHQVGASQGVTKGVNQ